MRRLLLSLSFTLAIALVLLQFPNSIYTVMRDAVLSVAAVGSLSSQEAYGARLGEQVHAVVNNIHARVNNSQITHVDVLTIMCMESAGRVGDVQPIVSSAGARGVTQVMPDTLAYYARTNKGGFYLDDRPDLLHSDSRFAIEAGALIYNNHLMNYVPKYGPLTGRTVAAIAYNGGPGRVGLPKDRLPKETRDYAYRKLPECFNQIKRGVSPVNTTIWKAMVAKVWELTNGMMSLNGAPGIPSEVLAQSTVPQTSYNNPIQNITQRWWSSPKGRELQESMSTQPQTVAPIYNSIAPQEPQREQSWVERIFNTKEIPSNNKTKIITKAASSLECNTTPRGVRLKWSCPSASTVTKGYAPDNKRFNTHGANIGSIHAIGAPEGEYKIVCIQSHRVLSEATCNAVIDESTNKSLDIIN